MQINTNMVDLDVVTKSHIKDALAPVIYNFFPNVSPGVKSVQSPKYLVYLPITVDAIHNIVVWLTDQNHKPLNFSWRRINDSLSPSRVLIMS